MKIIIKTRSSESTLAECEYNGLSVDINSGSFQLLGAPVGVNVLCDAKPQEISIFDSVLYLIFGTEKDANDFQIALKEAIATSDRFCISAMD